MELGYKVEATKVTGDQGADLILSKADLRIAVQVKGYFSSVANSAVQEAFAGMAYYKCHFCAVVTNSRFTPAAKDVARNIGCALIDEDTLPEVILGRTDFSGLVKAAKSHAQGSPS